ncbi:MAG: hypothetical protein COV32_03175 [Candidatus Yonathbacteria bacterium CG10_big_fil_rev_8_21_14_0_10_43_136]|uniref:Uncharacterized protein n=2 Tax=Parcubacteria group TaxID=1794811 RepID=A0A2M7Q5G8_9BACT|nr:MAG: hypothetical protein AUK15_02965 [Candidatus Nomurabacteria bacterium CG2_30_43_9]PIQ35657.1 MAG: hypothetical protein COW60_02770 [Candidatus Yonathbacteria bacterium CG17_big_fil_post_rev_8_21_14_2_50_43_9]PIR40468.1 MAG: hypothetical protein COV32_03175 [Candidatus Yonathbacteria bacterium CG10_big_fil_rev_8_21_14_0_10_43_136]PIX57043.1 MAG: hypothetical protein COZ48_02775 [Candidatus Yonathbacteria bacterium CG_4_10_14_3_um_filter_43_12]PIY58686.1 MAG: hypothetical protein COY98_00
MQFPITLVIFLVAIALVNAFADVYHWYWTMRWFDMPMHFAGGAWLASFGVWWQYYRRGLVATGGVLQILGVCLVFALSIGLLWEAYEAVVSFFTVGHMNAIKDTIGDLLFDIIGGTAVAILVWAQTNKNNHYET